MPSAPISTRTPRFFRCGWVVRRNVILPGWKSLVLIFAALLLLGLVLFRGIHGFFAPNEPVTSDIFVVEGWIPNYALKQGLDLALNSPEHLLLLTGGLVRGEVETEPGDTYARMAMDRLRYLGVSLNQVRAVETPVVIKDRTYGCAVATRDWLASEGLKPKAINVVTMGVHARRSRLLFEKAFGTDVEVGIISIPNREYDDKVWWRYSEGVKEVLSEGAAYLYARFLFQP